MHQTITPTARLRLLVKADIRVGMRMACGRGKWAWTAVGLLGLGMAGCDNNPQLVQRLQQRADALELDLKHCTQEVEDRDAQIARLHHRIENEPRLAGVTLDDLFVVARISLVSRTGGADFDGQPGDDGVIVYLQPLDADGDVLKAAGEITVQLLDLTTPGEPRALETYVFSKPDALRTHWYGGLLTNHYTLRCAFPPRVRDRVPHEVYLRVTFLDWLTGREFTASKAVTISRIDPGNALVPLPLTG